MQESCDLKFFKKDFDFIHFDIIKTLKSLNTQQKLRFCLELFQPTQNQEGPR